MLCQALVIKTANNQEENTRKGQPQPNMRNLRIRQRSGPRGLGKILGQWCGGEKPACPERASCRWQPDGSSGTLFQAGWVVNPGTQKDSSCPPSQSLPASFPDSPALQLPLPTLVFTAAISSASYKNQPLDGTRSSDESALVPELVGPSSESEAGL